jgi:hypothetical protein
VLEVADELPECLAPEAVPLGFREDCLGTAQGSHGDGQAFTRESFHQVREAAAFGTQQVCRRNPDSVEEEFRGVLRVQSYLVELSSPGEARGACLDDDQAKPARTGRGIGPGDHDDQIGVNAVRDERLLSVDHPCPAITSRGRAYALHVAARAGLRHRDRADDLAGGQPWEPATLLLVCAQIADIWDNDVVLHGETRAQGRRADLGELIEDDHLIAEVGLTAPAEFCRDGEADDALLACCTPDVAIDEPFVLPPLQVGPDLPADEFTHEGAVSVVVGGKERAFHPGLLMRTMTAG